VKKLFALFTLALFVSGALFAQIRSGSPAWVSVRQAAVKSSTWFFAGTRGNLSMGDQVSVLQISGNWAEIRSTATPPLSGWTAIGNLSNRLIVAEGTTASAREVALAGKGFDRDVENVYRASGDFNFEDVDRMERLTVSQEELFRFLTDGRLNTGEPQ
jgi:hypothetical protein